MPVSVTLPSDLLKRIDCWIKEVARYTEDYTRAPTRTSDFRGRGFGANGMRLRSSAKRTGLAEISGNKQTPKRKVSDVMEDKPQGETRKKTKTNEEIEHRGREHRGRGRPKGSKNKGTLDGGQHALPLRSPPFSIPNLPSSDLLPSGNSGLSPRKGGSPKKKGVKRLDQAMSEASIDMAYLATCAPAIRQTDFPSLRAAKKDIPTTVIGLYNKLRNVPHGVIPSELKELYESDGNTPRKSKDPHLDIDYLPPSKAQFPLETLLRLKKTVDQVYTNAARNHRLGAHERQWGSLVYQLLSEVPMWPGGKDVVVFNVENCTIQPGEVRPERPNGAGPVAFDLEMKSPGTEKADAAESIGRMIDWSLGLDLDDEDVAVINSAFRNLPDHAQSLNQSLSYIKRHPLFADFELKPTLSNRDPEVQIAIWASAALLKKRLHGWDTTMPMPAVVVNGHAWEYFLLFEIDNDVMMVGPMHFGSTATVNGIWMILYRLHIIMEWGSGRYKEWFQNHIMLWARDVSKAKPDML
ncbi:MAG: hypothetical protein Q9217_006989 [Psora testacea]